MKIAVTGANGFVGRYLTKELATSHEVVAVVRPTAQLSDASRVRIVDDIGSETEWRRALEGIDVVVHCAARVHVMKETSTDPLADFREVNTNGTRVLAEEAARQGVKRLVFLSSVKVHGEGRNGNPYSITDAPAPVDPYGVSKWEAEQALAAVSKESELAVSVLRSTVAYGAGVKGNIERIARLVRSGLPLPFGLVHNRRSMLAISNLSRWVARAVADERADNVTALMSDAEPISTKMLASWIAEGMKVRPRMVPVPVSFMKSVAKAVGKDALASRLVDDLEVRPTFEAYPGLKESISKPSVELRAFGREFNEWEAHR